MKRAFLLIAVFMGCLQAQGRVLFVKAGSYGNGVSWDRAFGDLQSALRAAQAGDEVWVAKGIYLPTASNNRLEAFFIPSGVKLLGGFAGHETSSQARDFTLNRTILSGDIGVPNLDADNSFTVVVFRHADPSTMLDGFEITGGNANLTTQAIDPGSCGGAIFNDASNGVSSPLISNCFFKRNRAFYGGAIYNNGAYGDCSGTRIIQCEFFENDAPIEGGAIFNQSTNGKCNLTIQYCNFDNNQSVYGAGIFNYGGFHGQTNPLIENCVFSGNGAALASGVYSKREQSGSCAPVILGCRFAADNSEMVGHPVGGNTLYGNPPKAPKNTPVIRQTTVY